MTKLQYEILLFALVSMNAAILLLIAGVLRQMMNELDDPAFQRFVGSLMRHSSKSPFLIAILNIPALIAIPYSLRYGIGNRWIVSGLSVWLVSGLLAKAFKWPVYRSMALMKESQKDEFKRARRRLDIGNSFQALMYAAATCVMAMNFV